MSIIETLSLNKPRNEFKFASYCVVLDKITQEKYISFQIANNIANIPIQSIERLRNLHCNIEEEACELSILHKELNRKFIEIEYVITIKLNRRKGKRNYHWTLMRWWIRYLECLVI